MLGPVPYSPDLDVFATPPTTPMTSEHPIESVIRPSLSRSSSRPSNLHISKTPGEFKPDILLESQSPPGAPSTKSPTHVITSQVMSTSNGANDRAIPDTNSPSDGSGHNSHPKIPTITTTDDSQPSVTSPQSAASPPILRSHTHSQSPMTSPCFVHSNLDKGASFSEWLKSSNGPAVDVAPVLKPMSADTHKTPSRRYRKVGEGQVIPIPYDDDKAENVFYASDYDYDDDEGSASLTKQLADTAVGVREMSKQLGALPESRFFLLRALNKGRPHPYQIKYSECPDCDQGARQSSYRTYACPSPLSHEKAQV